MVNDTDHDSLADEVERLRTQFAGAIEREARFREHEESLRAGSKSWQREYAASFKRAGELSEKLAGATGALRCVRDMARRGASAADILREIEQHGVLPRDE